MLTVNRTGGVNIGGDYMEKGVMFHRATYQERYGAAIDHMIENGNVLDSSARVEPKAQTDRMAGAELPVEAEAEKEDARPEKVSRSTIGRIEIPKT